MVAKKNRGYSAPKVRNTPIILFVFDRFVAVVVVEVLKEGEELVVEDDLDEEVFKRGLFSCEINPGHNVDVE